jgi:antagonist of KipI
MLRVIAGGLQTTVQDLGRMGSQRSGIPVGGAMDRIALRIGNALVGNGDGDAALEASLIGPSIVFERATVLALAGADLEPTIDDLPMPVWHPLWAPRGATLRFGRPRAGCRTYVAVAGGVEVPLVFGSRSTYLRAGFGGFNGRSLRAGDEVSVGKPSELSERIAHAMGDTGARPLAAGWSIGFSLRPTYRDEVMVRIIAAPHTALLTEESRSRLTGMAFRVSSSSDRMGYRLEGVELELRHTVEILSEGVAFGTIQLPTGGAPIVLMADRQTTGGYPRIGEVASVDLPLIAQLKPADRVRFRFISLDEAQRLYLAAERELIQARHAIRLRLSRGTS